MFDQWLGCSTISFRRLALGPALDVIAGCGFREIDLGALPGVCDHVPFELTGAAVRDVVATVRASELAVRSVNGDIGDLNRPLGPAAGRDRETHLRRLIELAAGCAADALVLPCGGLSHDPVSGVDEDLDLVAGQLDWAADIAAPLGVSIWVEAPHYHRLVWNLDLAERLAKRLRPEVGLVLDTSHIVASGGDPVLFVELFGPRITHVHLRDATPGEINLSIGNGDVDFAATLGALRTAGYRGHLALELETRDVRDDERPAAAIRAADYLSALR